MSLETARAVADAVLYEGYLLYPYRASSRKNQIRWQFGVLGPPGAAEAGIGEEPDIASECLLRPGSEGATVRVLLRFLQLQTREVEKAGAGGFARVERLAEGGREWMSWDEAAEVERDLGAFTIAALDERVDVEVAGGEDVELLRGEAGDVVGRLVRRRRPLRATVTLTATATGDGVVRLRLVAQNVGAPARDAAGAIGVSLIGAHLLLQADGADFVSLRDPGDARDAADACRQHRCWPVLAGADGPDGAGTDVLLVSPIILDDHPELAPESAGALFDSTEIDEILTLRILTLTEEEKAEARATDPRAAEIIDRCEAMSPDELALLHGAIRDPRAATAPDPFDVPTFSTPTECPPPAQHAGVSRGSGSLGGEQPWWDPETDASVNPATDAVAVAGVSVARDSLVRITPSRRADAQDLFFAGQVARVAGVHHDVDGGTHVAVVLVDDPAADLHDWYGRYLYFAPDELEPLAGSPTREGD